MFWSINKEVQESLLNLTSIRRIILDRYADVEIEDLKYGEVSVRNKAIGLNFYDVYIRRSIIFKAPLTPFTPVGVVIVVVPGLTSRQVRYVVSYGVAPIAVYAEEHILAAERVVHVPSYINPIAIAFVILKEVTAQFLLYHCFKVADGTVDLLMVYGSLIYIVGLGCSCIYSVADRFVELVMVNGWVADDGS
ncbi:quinone oxidoreductase 1 [Tanacetum coccineum]